MGAARCLHHHLPTSPCFVPCQEVLGLQQPGRSCDPCGHAVGAGPALLSASSANPLPEDQEVPAAPRQLHWQHRALHHPASPVEAPRAGSVPAQSNLDHRNPWVTLGAPLRARTPKRRASASPKPLPALKPTKFPFTPLSLSPQSRSQPLALRQDQARRGAARRGQQSGSRLGAGKAAPRRAQDLSQAELSIRPPSPQKTDCLRTKKNKQRRKGNLWM